MTIYLATNSINDVVGFNGYDSTAGRFDSDYVSQSIYINHLSGAVFPAQVMHNGDTTGDSEAWFHFEMFSTLAPSSGSDDGSWLRLNAADGTILAYIDVLNGSCTNRVYNAGGSSANAPSSWLMAVSSLNIYDLMYKDDGTTCTFEVYINGSLQQSVTIASTGTAKMPTRLQFDNTDIGIGTGHVWCYSQFIMANESTVGMKMKELLPNAVGNYTDLAADVTAVDDDDISSGWVGDTNAQKQSFTITGYTLGVGKAVHSVLVNADVRIGTTGPQNIRPFVRISATDYLAPSDITPFTSSKRGMIGHAWTQNPATTAAWTESEIQALEAGIEIKT